MARLRVFLFNASSCNACDIEILSTLTKIEGEKGLEVELVSKSEEANVLLVTGACNRLMARFLREVYSRMPDPKVVVAVGTCACGKGIVCDSYAVIGVEEVVPVDIYVPGCPPRPSQIIEGLAKAAKLLSERLRDTDSAGELRYENSPPLNYRGLPVVDSSKCRLCGTCERSCPANVIKVNKQERTVTFDYIRCIQCGQCEIACPVGAISLTKMPEVLEASRRSKYRGVFKVTAPAKPATK